MKIAILGAGGVGGAFGGALARAGHDVSVLARGAHLDAIRARGLEVQTPEETFTATVAATDAVADLLGVEVAVVAVKTYALDAIAPAAQRLAEAGATILPLLNGASAFERLAAAGVPEARILSGLAEVSAAKVAPGVVQRTSAFQRVVVGERSGEASDRATSIAGAFREAGLEARVSPDIEVDLWRKLAFISTMAAACGLARAPIGPVRDAPGGAALLARAVEEALAVGRARGLALAADLGPKILGFISSLPGAMVPSFLLDLEAGGPTELDDLCGAVSRLGRAAGVPTPTHDVAAAALGARAPARSTAAGFARVLTLLAEMEATQAAKVIDLARRLVPGLTAEDIRNPHDFPDSDDPDWHYVDGQLAGIQAVRFAVATLVKDAGT